MSIAFTCGHCGKAFDLGPEMAGKTGRCKRCKRLMFIPFQSTTKPVRTWSPEASADSSVTTPSPVVEPALPPRAPAPRVPLDSLTTPTGETKKRKGRGGGLRIGSWDDDLPLVNFARRVRQIGTVLGLIWLIGYGLTHVGRRNQPNGERSPAGPGAATGRSGQGHPAPPAQLAPEITPAAGTEVARPAPAEQPASLAAPVRPADSIAARHEADRERFNQQFEAVKKQHEETRARIQADIDAARQRHEEARRRAFGGRP